MHLHTFTRLVANVSLEVVEPEGLISGYSSEELFSSLVSIFFTASITSLMANDIHSTTSSLVS